jgi:hypothetical protein
MNATWQYSINNGNDCVNGTGSRFTLADNTTYAANAIQVRQGLTVSTAVVIELKPVTPTPLSLPERLTIIV